MERKKIGILTPCSWLRDASYPVTIDPTIENYTLENDNDTYAQAGEQLGYSVSVGDFNGDGYADVLTGAPYNDYGG